MKDKITFKNFTKISQEEARQVYRWRTDPEIKQWMSSSESFSMKSHLDFIQNLKNNGSKKYYLVFFNKEPIGVFDLTNIDYSNNTCYSGSYFDSKYRKYSAVISKLASIIYKKYNIKKVLAFVKKDNYKALILNAMKLGGKIFKEDENYIYFEYRNQESKDCVLERYLNEYTIRIEE